MSQNPLIHELPFDTLDSAYKALASLRCGFSSDTVPHMSSDASHGFYLLLETVSEAIAHARDSVAQG